MKFFRPLLPPSIFTGRRHEMLIYEASIKYIAGINRTRALLAEQAEKIFFISAFSLSIGHFFNKSFSGWRARGACDYCFSIVFRRARGKKEFFLSLFSLDGPKRCKFDLFRSVIYGIFIEIYGLGSTFSYFFFSSSASQAFVYTAHP